MTEVDRLGWAVTVPLRAGEHVLGVRAGSEALGDVLCGLFPDRLVEEADPPGNLSVHLAPTAERGEVQELHQLYETYSLQLRTRDATRVLHSLWHELHMRDVRSSRSVPLVDATVLVKDGEAHLLPSRVRWSVIRDLRRWESVNGLRLLDVRWVEVDMASGCLVVEEPRFPSSHVELEGRLGELGVDHRAGGSGVTGRVPIASWTFEPAVLSPGERVMLAAGQVLDRSVHVDAGVLGDLANLLASVADHGPDWTDTGSLRTAR